MKHFLFLIAFLLSTQAFSQIPDVKYYGGIYDKILYFNFVIHNEDTCSFIIETSADGRDYQEVFCDSVRPVPIATSHSFKIATNEKQLFIKVIVQTDNKIIYFPPASFTSGLYTYSPVVTAMNYRVIRAKF